MKLFKQGGTIIRGTNVYKADNIWGNMSEESLCSSTEMKAQKYKNLGAIDSQ